VRRITGLGGIGAVAFGVLTVVALLVADPPGGTYGVSDTITYLAKGHRVALFISFYLSMLGVLGLVCLLGYLREAVAVRAENEVAARTFWAVGLTAAASLAAGWGIAVGNGLAHVYGGHDLLIAPSVTYLVSEVGSVLIFGVAPVLLGLGLIALMFSVPTVLPSWLRWVTVVGGLAGVLSPAFFPFFIMMLWALVLGVWILVSAQPLQEGTPRPATRATTAA
jgi:hypothetical protein